MTDAGARRLTLLLVLLGAVLRAWQYAAGAALWLDEIAIARNVIDRSTVDLVVRPLDYEQTSPPGFLLLTKLAILVLGTDERAFRLLPFLASLAALVLFPSLAWRLLSQSAALLAVALFALAYPLVHYAAELKPYALDVLATVVICRLALRWYDRRAARDAVVLAAAGLVTVWFSSAAVLVLAGVGLALAGAAVRERRPRDVRHLVGVGVAWVAACGAATVSATSG